MPLAPNFLERLVFLTLNQAPGPSLDMWSGPTFHIVLAALRLNLFETLAPNPLTSEQTAAKIGSDLRGTKILLDTLATLGYVGKTGDQYGLTNMTRKWLMDGNDGINFKPFFLYWGAIMEQFMPQLESSLRSGEPMNLYQWIETQPDVSRNFQEGMIAIARYVASDIVNAITVNDNTRRVLDVGGGHGIYSVALCRQYPQLSAVVFDSEQALVTGHKTIEQEQMSGRITLCEGNFITDTLPDGFDLALVFNIVHGLLPEDNITLLRKIKESLNPGGQVIVLEQIHNVAPLPLTNTVSHVLSMAYYHLIGGQVYTFEDIRDWLERAGYNDIRRKNILKASSAVISGSVK